tara:strand:- start:14609 stop:15400 length:792 start_codon:yes stop_codon:yes gene_type:complete
MSEISGINIHIEELRKRVIRSVISVLVITVFILTFHATPVDVMGITLYYPYPEPLDNIAAQFTNVMKNELVPQNVQLIQTAPGQAFFSQVYIAALIGIVLSIPIIIREFVSFLKPALKEREIHVGRSITIPAIGLFITGCVFSYAAVIPFILDFLYKYGESAGLVTFLNIMDFVTFVLQFLLAFGISFQLPLVMYAISLSGLTDAKFWRRNFRYAIIAIVVFGAVITPDGSGVTMWFVSLPMIGLYATGMIIVERQERQTNKL